MGLARGGPDRTLEPLQLQSPACGLRLLFTSNRHALDQHRAGPDAAAQIDIVAYRDDLAIHVFEIARDRDLVHGVGNRAVLHPESGGTARIVSSDAVDALPHQ